MNSWIRCLVPTIILFSSSIGFSQTICTKVLNPELQVRDLSIKIGANSARELMIYAMAGATQATAEGIRKRLHRGPSQKFYAPNEQYELLARAHMSVDIAQRESNYARFGALADQPNRSAGINFANNLRDLARDLRDSIENQQTVSETVGDLFFYRLFAEFLTSHTRLRLTYLYAGQSFTKDVTLVGPMASTHTATSSPKFEFLPIQAGATAKSVLVVEPSMVLNVQLID